MNPGDRIADRFTVRRRIGAGSFGIVYEVFDPVRNKLVALKALRQATPDALYRFKREFRGLADMAERNLVRLYDLVSEGDRWFVSMELIRGRNFIEYVRGVPFSDSGDEEAVAAHAAARAADPTRLAIALPQLATAVATLHATGKLHRDIKPSNVVVSADDERLVLLDFGLILETDEFSSSRSEATSGTPAYMSPEQGGGDPVGPPSDWYAVGMMLYEALAGTVPFKGTFLEILNAKRAGDVPPPSSMIAGIPPALDDLCRDLLRVDPTARPGAVEILQRLGASAPPHISFRSSAFPLVGREHHLRSLRDAFEAAVSGTVTTISVQGDSGAGKSTLVRTFIEGLRDEIPDVLILTGRCYQRESLPYKGVDSLVDALHRYLSRLDLAEIDALLPRDFAAAEQLFPMLQEVGDLMRFRRRVAPELETNQHTLRERAFAAMREVFFRLAERTKLVLVIDDLQWGDADSAELLEYVLRPPDAPPLLFIAAYRSDAVEASPFVPLFRERVPSRDLLIAPLSADESQQCALQLLGGNVADPVETARVIARESDGSPLFITELVRAFTMAGPTVLRRDTTIAEVLQVRLRALEESALAVLQMICVHGRPILRAPLHRALSGGEFDKSLSALAAQQLIRTREIGLREAVEPAHDRIAEAALALLTEAELRRRHAQLAAALETFEADAELIADHLLAAGELSRAAKYVEEAAENAAAALAFDRATRLFRRAITLNPARAGTLRRRLSEIAEHGATS